jgi:hypothetical protein
MRGRSIRSPDSPLTADFADRRGPAAPCPATRAARLPPHRDPAAPQPGLRQRDQAASLTALPDRRPQTLRGEHEATTPPSDRRAGKNVRAAANTDSRGRHDDVLDLRHVPTGGGGILRSASAVPGVHVRRVQSHQSRGGATASNEPCPGPARALPAGCPEPAGRPGTGDLRAPSVRITRHRSARCRCWCRARSGSPRPWRR